MYLFFLFKTAYFSPGFLKIKHIFIHGKVYPETHSPAKHCVSNINVNSVYRYTSVRHKLNGVPLQTSVEFLSLLSAIKRPTPCPCISASVKKNPNKLLPSTGLFSIVTECYGTNKFSLEKTQTTSYLFLVWTYRTHML